MFKAIKSMFLIMLMLGLCLGLSRPGAAGSASLDNYRGACSSSLKVSESGINFHAFTISQEADPEIPALKMLKISKHNETILEEGENAASLSEAQMAEDFPQPGDCTLMLPHFTGGAHCCFTLYWLTQTPRGAMLNEISMGNYGDPSAENGKIALPYKVIDGSFSYYEAGKGKNALSLSFADSPGFERYLVYENGRFRPDNIAEFAIRYKELAISEASRAKEEKRVETKASRIISAGYYQLMSGESESSLQGFLQKNLPAQLAHLSRIIATDLSKAAIKFSPVNSVYNEIKAQTE